MGHTASYGVALSVGLLGVFTFASSLGETPPAQLTAEGILREIVGHTIQFQNDANNQVQEYFATDGSIHGWSRKKGVYQSEWQIRFGNYLCLVAASPLESGCVRVVIQPRGKLEFHLDIGDTEGPFELLPGNPRKL
jgi:hypothetical protein